MQGGRYSTIPIYIYMTSCQNSCSRCRCLFAFGPVASGAAFGNAFGKSTVSYFCFRFFPVKQRLSWPSVMPSPVAFGKAFGKSTVSHVCFRFLFWQDDPAKDVSHCSYSDQFGHSMPPHTAQSRSSNQLNCVIWQLLGHLKLLARSSFSTCGKY